MPSARLTAQKIAMSIAEIAAEKDSGDEMETDHDRTVADAESEEEEEQEDAVDQEDEDEEDEEDEEGQADESLDQVDDDGDQNDEEGSDEGVRTKDKDVAPPPKKRKRIAEQKSGKLPKKRKCAASASDEQSDSVPPPREIEYKICVYTPQQMKKKESSRGSPNTDVVTLKSDQTWAVLKSRILSHISTALSRPSPNIEDYNVFFTVPRQVRDPLQLVKDKYAYMITKALLIQKGPNVRVIVEPKESAATEKENEDMTESDRTKKKKSKIPNAKDILPGNVALNEKIGQLRERWQCPTPRGACGSEHCFFSETEPEHFPLSHAHMASWGAAMLKGKVFADIDTPPNNQLFDRVANAARAAQSPLLQRRLELREQSATKNAPAAPQVNINFPPEFLNLARAQGPTPLVPAPPAAPAAPTHNNSMLIPWPRVGGEVLSIDTFCFQFDLDLDIAARFDQHKYRKTSAFEFVKLDDLKEMGFAHGEIAELKVAVGKWSQLPGGD